MSEYELTHEKVDKFFENETTVNSLDYLGKRFQSELEDYLQKRCDDFRYYLKDEFRLHYVDLVKDGVKEVVRQLLLGNQDVLAEYNLAADSWGVRCDHLGIRRKIVEDNKDIIQAAEIQSLKEELARAREQIRRYQGVY